MRILIRKSSPASHQTHSAPPVSGGETRFITGMPFGRGDMSGGFDACAGLRKPAITYGWIIFAVSHNFGRFLRMSRRQFTAAGLMVRETSYSSSYVTLW